MALRLHVEKGGEKYFPFARKKLDELKAFMRFTHTPLLNKFFKVADATIWIQSARMPWGQVFDWIRITAGTFSRFIVRSGSSQLTIFSSDGTVLETHDYSSEAYADGSLCAALGTRIVMGAGLSFSNFSYYVVDTTNWTTVAGPISGSDYQQTVGTPVLAPAIAPHGTSGFATWVNPTSLFSFPFTGAGGRAITTNALLAKLTEVAIVNTDDGEVLGLGLRTTRDFQPVSGAQRVQRMITQSPSPPSKLNVINPAAGTFVLGGITFSSGASGNGVLVSNLQYIARVITSPFRVELVQHDGTFVAEEEFTVAGEFQAVTLAVDDTNLIVFSDGSAGGTAFHYALPSLARTTLPNLTAAASVSHFWSGNTLTDGFGGGIHVLERPF